MSHDPEQPHSTARAALPEESFGVALVGVTLMFGFMLGVSWVVTFHYPYAELAIGLAMLATELVFVLIAVAVDWSGPSGKYSLPALALGWLGWTLTSGTLLAMYIFDRLSGHGLAMIAMIAAVLAPFLLVVVVAILTEKTRRFIIAWRSPTGA